MSTNALDHKTASIFSVDTKYIGVLDGVRALGVLCVLWFHFWQQTWLMPTYATPFLSWAGVSRINPDILRRVGYLCVDLMLLLSAFVLYLPYARRTFCGTPVDSVKVFFKKRFARIVPSYLFAVIVMYAVAMAQGAYKGKAVFALKDLLTHLTFTQMLFNDTYLFTGITAVMWTVCIEVALYLVFPLLARAFGRRPLLTYGVMVLFGIWFTIGVSPALGEPRIMVNRFLTFLPVFANGMMAAHLYVWYAERVRHKAIPSILGTIAAAAALYLILRLFRFCAASGDASHQQVWQMQNRMFLSLAFTVFLLGALISMKPVRKILDNRVLSAIAAVSYNLYLWHQWLIVKLCSALGAKSGQDIANGGVSMQWTVTITGLVIAFAVAAFITYGIEKPISRLILNTGRES
ncbi:MAG: acyltransferase [Clostridia bacterium]|nr:acyltransferase [Clostridia bacterium]